MSEITPYSNRSVYIPKDPIYDNGSVYPADHFLVRESTINGVYGEGPLTQVERDLAASGGDDTGGGGGVSPDTLVPLIDTITPSTDETLFLIEPTLNPVTLTVSVTLKNISPIELEYQWQRKENGSTDWNDLPGEDSDTYIIPSGATVNNDNGDSYRCKVIHPKAVNTPQYSGVWSLNIKRLITITSQPTPPFQMNPGESITLVIGATITSDVISYQWQKKEFGETTWNNISGATNSTYTTPLLFALEDSGDEYRCILTNPLANTVTSNSVEIIVYGADFRVDPSINGIRYWSFANDGDLILDPSENTEYTIRPLNTERTKVAAVMWGQGTCSSQGGYTEGAFPIVLNSDYFIKLNGGRGIASAGGNSGGGYSGIFDGVSASLSSAIMIAGGAGGAGTSSTNSCINSGGDGGGDTGENGQNSDITAGFGYGGSQLGGGAGGAGSEGGDALFTSNYSTFTVPNGVTSISMVCIGGGGGGASGVGSSYSQYTAGFGGGGGGLAYTNNVSVTPGEVLTVEVGFGGPGGNGPTSGGGAGGATIIRRSNGTALCWASGGGPGDWDVSSGGAGGGRVVGTGGGTGGTGGSGGGFGASCGGGGGAGGYSGNGGNGGSGSSGFSGSGGGGGGGAGGSSNGAYGGGGVDLYGLGNNGSGGSGGPGGGGSGGFAGSTTPVNFISTNGTPGGSYGGGGGAAANRLTNGGFDGGRGANGAARIIWGTSRSFPSTNVGSVPTFSVTNTYSTEGSTTVTIPSSATNITYEIVGGTGGAGGYSSGRSPGPGAAGGRGQKITGTLSPTVAGKTLTIRIAGNGSTGGGVVGGNGGNGYTNGGVGGYNYSDNSGGFSGAAGGGGGGSSAILDGTTRILVAGGGGGGAPIMYSGSASGAAGQTSTTINTTGTASNGVNGGNSGASFNGAGGGGGGGNPGGEGGFGMFSGNDQSGGGGSGGAGYYNTSFVSSATATTGTTNARVILTYSVTGSAGSPGTALQGGSAGAGTYAGGGGGGGYYGGGGGAGASGSIASGGGGGGSGYVSEIVLNGSTSGYANETDSNRGGAGDINSNSRLVIKQAFLEIVDQPSSAISFAGQQVVFTINAQITTYFTEVINYQWQKKESGSNTWNNISGATTNSYTIASISSSDNGDSYRCIISNEFCASVTSQDADITVLTLQSSPVIYRTAGNANFTIPAGVSKFRFHMWGAGGDGTGEGCGGPYSGGSGGYITATIDVSEGDVFLARVGSYNNGSQDGLEGFGAGKGGGWTGLFKYTQTGTVPVAIAGGGGGAGQAGNGGYGGTAGLGTASGSGGNGTGPNAGTAGTPSSGGSSGGVFYTVGNNFNSGGPSGGSGINQGNRGGGGGGGYYGGGGGSGNSSGNCSGGGGGGGSGFIDVNYLGPSDQGYGTANGRTGAAGGVDPIVNTPQSYVDFTNSVGGYPAGRSGNNGLIVFELTYAYDFSVSPAIAGKTLWSTIADGPLVLDGSTATEYTLVAQRTVSLPVNMWGQGSCQAYGGYSTGTVSFTGGETYKIRLNSGRGSGGTSQGNQTSDQGGGYAGIFRTSTVSQSNAIMIAGGAGGSGRAYGCTVAGGGGGGTNGSNGGNSPDSEIGSTGGGRGTQSSGGSAGGGSGGAGGGSALQGGTGGTGQLSGFPNAAGGGGGGGGYYGGGGGGAGNDFGNTTRSSSGGGGGSGYINSTYVTNGQTTSYGGESIPNKGDAGKPGNSSRIIFG